MHTQTQLTAAGTNVCCPAEALERKPHGPDNLTVFATCWGPTAAREANAAEVARRWNAHDALLRACDLAISHLEGVKDYVGAWDQEVIDVLRAAVAAAKGEAHARP